MNKQVRKVVFKSAKLYKFFIRNFQIVTTFL